MNNYLIFRVTAWWAGIYHLALGLIGIFADKEFMSLVIQTVFGASVEITPQVFYLVKFCSAYMTAFAVATIILAMNPVKYRSLIWVPLTLFIIRLLQRVLFYSTLAASFDIPARTESITIIALIIMPTLLYLSRPKVSS